MVEAMSYPEPRYFGESGEVSATLRRGSQEPDLTYPTTGVKVDYLATGKSTDGEYGLYRWHFGPGETGPGPHFHRTISESFFILSGTVRLFTGEEWIDAVAGDYLFVPKGGLHGFRNVAGEPASMRPHRVALPEKNVSASLRRHLSSSETSRFDRAISPARRPISNRPLPSANALPIRTTQVPRATSPRL